MKTRSYFVPFFFLQLCLAFTSSAVSMIWNQGFTLAGNDGRYHLHWDPDSYFDGNDDSLAGLRDGMYPEIYLNVDQQDPYTVLSAVNLVNLGYGFQWVKLNEGEVADQNTTRNLDSYFLKGWIDSNSADDVGRSDYNITAPSDGTSSVFLGFASDYLDTGSSELNLDIIYGWVELIPSGNSITLGRTAVDISGAPLVVGQIPEPASFALAILGGVVMLRRRR